MTEDAVQQTKSIARWTIAIIWMHTLYSAFEMVRHLIVDGVGEHTAGHGAAAGLGIWVLSHYSKAGLELFRRVNL